MKCKTIIKSVREFVLENDIINDKKREITFIYKVLREKSINGGLGDRDEVFEMYLCQEGWKEKTYIHEYGQRANMSQFNVKSDMSINDISDEDIINYLNGEESSFSDVISFYNTVEKVCKENGYTSVDQWLLKMDLD